MPPGSPSRGRPVGVIERAPRQSRLVSERVDGRVCTKCLTHKGPAAFGVSATGALQSWCSECQNVGRRQRYQGLREQIVAYKLNTGCADCGYDKHPAALHFDHLPGTVKLFDVARGVNGNEEKLWTEIAKCEVVCANCHAVRTADRRGELDASDVA